MDISQGKQISAAGPDSYKKNPTTLTKPKKAPIQNGPRSLNIAVRKRENDRIEKENHAFAKRLFENGGQISHKKLENDFKHHLKQK